MSEPISPQAPFSPAKAGSLLWRIVRRLLRIKWLWITAGVLLLVRLGAGACTTYVPPNMVGVKQVYYGSGAGIKPEYYGPGLHFVTAGYERLHLFPRDLQVINFSDSPSEVSVQSRSAP